MAEAMQHDSVHDEALPWHLGVFDAHCHPTDTLATMQSIPLMRAKVLTVMATRAQDQDLVAEAAERYGVSEAEISYSAIDWSQQHRIIPAFGWHPWFSHQMYDETEYKDASTLTNEQKVRHYQQVLTPRSDNIEFLSSLPDPKPFGHFLARQREYLECYATALVGEIGLDRSFRIPEAWLPEQDDHRDDALTPGGREGRKLSPYRVSLDHQKKVLLAQLRLAGELQRAVSVHGVQAHGIVHDTLAETWKGHTRHTSNRKDRKKQAAAIKAQAEPLEESGGSESADAKPYPPRICLHSFSGPAETVKQYMAPSVPCEIFFSFSTTINAWSDDGSGKVEAAVRAVPDDRLLIESDLHTAGERMDNCLETIVRKLCHVKGWGLEEGVVRLGKNWKRFAFGV